MDLNRPTMSEGTARFWSTVFGGITAVSLLTAGLYSLVQYVQTQKLQIATTEFSARQAFNNKHLELCSEASVAAGTLATSKDAGKQRAAKEDFWRLYWGPLGIVEESEVATAMVEFGNCLERDCTTELKSLSLKLAHACRAEAARDFKLELPEVPGRPKTAKAETGAQ